MELSRASQVRWNKLDADHGGALEMRVHQIRSGPIHITRMEAMIGALSEYKCDIAQTAAILGIDEQTVKNHRGDIRKKMGKPREACAFDLIFLNYPPPARAWSRKIRSNNKIIQKPVPFRY